MNFVFNLRISERYNKKLDYIAKKKDISKQKFCQKLLFKAIDQEIDMIMNATDEDDSFE